MMKRKSTRSQIVFQLSIQMELHSD